MTTRAAILLVALYCPAMAPADQKGEREDDGGCKWSEQWLHLSSGQDAQESEPNPPKKVRDKAIAWPKSIAGHTGSGHPIVEAVINADGKVVDARVVRPIRWEPPWPEFDEAILDAVREWEFKPAMRGKERVPACLTVAISIYWR